MITIGDKTFKTKVEAEKFIQEILYRQPLSTPLEGSDLTFIYSLLECHPDVDVKVGVGVKSIIVECEKEFRRTKHFSVIRIDGTSTDFSFKKCLSPNLYTPIKLFRSSARRVIAGQVIDFKKDFFLRNQNSNAEVLCQLTGVLVTKSNSHIDHTPPMTFDKIISDFIEIHTINVNDVKFVEADNGIGRVFVDSNLKNTFSDYHQKTAQLRVVSQSANLRQKKK